MTTFYYVYDKTERELVTNNKEIEDDFYLWDSLPSIKTRLLELMTDADSDEIDARFLILKKYKEYSVSCVPATVTIKEVKNK